MEANSNNSTNRPPHFDFLTLFPDTIKVWLTTSILGRAHEKGLFTFETVQLREFSENRHRSVDDSPYGGGEGMVLRLEPLVAAVEAIKARHAPEPVVVVYFSPRGQRIDQSLLKDLSSPEMPRHFLFVCGHYEGIDQRFSDHWVDLEISLGDFVLTGGELPAVALADTLIRRLAGTLSSEKAHRDESFSMRDPDSGGPLLEYPQYTRPPEFRGHRVPEVLLSGDHPKIRHWRQEQARVVTRERRADLTK